jgi:hypothetical protein
MEVEDGACGEVDVVIGREQGDEGNHEAGKGLDPALAIETAAATGREVFRLSDADSGEGSIRTKTRGHRPTNLVHLY